MKTPKSKHKINGKSRKIISTALRVSDYITTLLAQVSSGNSAGGKYPLETLQLLGND
jgi:hypothetical protein